MRSCNVEAGNERVACCEEEQLNVLFLEMSLGPRMPGGIRKGYSLSDEEDEDDFNDSVVSYGAESSGCCILIHEGVNP